MSAEVNLESDNLALLQVAATRDITHEVGHLAGRGSRGCWHIEARNPHTRGGVSPRPLLGKRTDMLKTNGRLLRGHLSQYIDLLLVCFLAFLFL